MKHPLKRKMRTWAHSSDSVNQAHYRGTVARESSKSQMDKDIGKSSNNPDKLASTPYCISYILFIDIIDTRIGVITKLEVEVKGMNPMCPDIYYMQ